MRAVSAIVVALSTAAVPSSATAGAGEQSISLEPSFAHLGRDDSKLYGGALGVSYEYRLDDRFAIRATGATGVYYDSAVNYSGHGVVALVYAFDVLKYVPYASLGIGGIAAFGDDIDDGVAPIAEAGGGLDVLHSRSFSYGAFARYESLFQATSYVTAGLRLTWRWGFF